MPLTLPSATIDTDPETAETYEWALGEYKTDAKGRPVRENGELIPINGLVFPLGNTMVVWNGSRATISLPRAGKPNLVLDKLMSAPEPKRTTKRGTRGKPEIDQYTFTGISERLLKQGIKPEDATVTFIVTGDNLTEGS